MNCPLFSAAAAPDCEFTELTGLAAGPELYAVRSLFVAALAGQLAAGRVFSGWQAAWNLWECGLI